MTAWTITALVALVLALACESAGAHAVLVGTQPVDGATLDQSPSQVTLTFSEAVSPSVLRVLDATGSTIAEAATPGDPRSEVVLALPRPLANGSYVVSYRVVSADSHVVAGSLTFDVGRRAPAAGGTAVTPVHADRRAPDVLFLSRALLYAALLFVAGAAMFVVLVERGRAFGSAERSVVLVACVVALIAAVIQLHATGALAVGADEMGLLQAAPWRAAVRTSLFQAFLLHVGGLALLVRGAGSQPGARRNAVLLVGAALALSGLGVSGHASTAPPRWLAAPVVVLHAFAAAFWVGAFWPLWRRWRVPDAGALAITWRFSRLALIAVAVLVACGVAMSILQLSAPRDLTGTDYGRWLLLKLALVTGLMSLGALNRYFYTPRQATDLRRGAALRKSIAREMVVAVLIVSVTAWLGERVPPRTQNAAASGSAETEVALRATDTHGKWHLDAKLTPSRRGANRMVLAFTNASGQRRVPLEVTITSENATLGIEPQRHAAVRALNGDFEIDDLRFVAAGRWIVGVQATVDDFENRVFAFDVAVAP